MDSYEVLGPGDVVCVIDTTGSMGPYIKAARETAVKQAEGIAERGDLDLRFAVVEYRDHPPQDGTFVARKYPFGPGRELQATLDKLIAGGGGDRPEAVYDGLIGAVDLDWRLEAEHLCFLIGDSPPHNPCVCHATPGGVIEYMGSKQITLHAPSIAGASDTARAFRELTDALGGVTTEVDAAPEAVGVYAATLDYASAEIGSTRAYMAVAMSMGPTASTAAVADSLGWTTDKVERARTYATKRGLTDPIKDKRRIDQEDRNRR